MKRICVGFVLAAVCPSALVLGCDFPPSDLEPEEWVVSSFPEDREQGVPRLVQMYVELQRLVAPYSVRFPAVRITSADLEERLVLHLEPVTRRIIIETLGDVPLQKQVTYKLVVDDLVDLDGSTQAEAYEALFRTGTDLGDKPAPPEVEWSQAEQILVASCAVEGCHKSPEPAGGLDLFGSDRVRQTAVGALARSVPPGWGTARGSGTDLHVFGFPILDVLGGAGRPAHSYLMYKVLDDPHILGSSMPPPDAGIQPLSRNELLTLSNWIRCGVPME